MKILKPISFLSAIILLSSCVKESPEPIPNTKRTVIVYINADNNLYKQYSGGKYYGALTDINEMEAGWDDRYQGSLIVYLNAPQSSGEPPRLYKIVHDTDPNVIASRVIKIYEAHDASDPATLSMVLRDVMQAQANPNYALIFWSHATGWVPKGVGSPLKSAPLDTGGNSAAQYTFGWSDSYGYSQMEIDDLARALPNGVKFDFIAFDACYMGCVEVAYELRNSCRYFVASAVETPVDGFQYDNMMGDIMKGDAMQMARKNYEHYNSLSGWWATCAMSAVDCSKLETLAAATKTLVTLSPRSLSDIPLNRIQDLGSSSYYRNTYFDFGDFINKTWADDIALANFNAALSDAVVVKYNTRRNLDSYNIDRYSGFSAFAPRSYQRAALKAYRERFAWSAASGIGSMQ